ncbi:MAG: sensor hybrid histidine kinase [Deltaproteobacteria bacterium]|nr:sensor hybrid histidine kinase [Deltaproteobacteria bacterium]
MYARYVGALLAAVAALLLRWGLESLAGGSLPHYVIFYPGVIIVALAAGLGPGIVFTATAALLADYYILHPTGFGIAHPADALGLALFSAMGIFMSVVAERLHRSHDRLEAAVAERTQALHHKEERLRLAQQAARIGSFDLNLQTGLNRWTPELEAMYGLEPGEFGMTQPAWENLVHPENRAEAINLVNKTFATGEPVEGEWRVVWPDGSEHWIFGRFQVYRDAAGTPLRLTGVNIDITERKQAEEELRRSRDEWELTFNSVPDLIAIIDDRHRIARVNRAMAEQLGRAPGDCVGLHCYQAIHGSILPPEFCPHSRTLDDGEEHAEEVFVESMGGDFLVSTTPLLNQEGRMTGSVHVARDISERKRSEEELRRAKEAAEAATRTKSLFLANMSHELRTPMTGVIGMLDLVLTGNLEKEQRECIEIAQTSALSLIRLLNDILDLTKIEMGKFSIEEQPLSIRQCVETTYNILLPVAKGKELAFVFTVADDVPEALIGDQVRLNQVLTNLAGNAVKFTEKGEVAIRVVSGGSTPGGKREVTFTVADTGIGIPEDKQHLLFGVFSQVDASHSRSYCGSGLGLAISKEIVERMGGTITFTSEAGQGSTFSCTIPFSEADAFPAAGEKAAAGIAPIPAEQRKPRLLVAEDDQVISQVLDLMFKRAHFDVDLVDSGHKVLEMWETGRYDLILMDVQMPLMNGFEATAAIREKERASGGHIPIVAMTAHALKEDEDRCLAAGMDSYISKPIDFRKSVQLIEAILIKQRDLPGKPV